ncbi:SpoIIE family protein phosphatase/ATP-binding protein [Streptomyces griseoloalbus]|uniref:Serine phosphatase RsbU (Regulator of sigma subunit)/PAS domain-containing protein/anti-sigma regulatory factor (Ser/Thr protein kinase) n=1 Tax=Streptomyces griseoloalbus TaxID=67303 RepID=A0A7W8BQ56_9ACTN|nr:SpoIIE family protein phosphatase/ATP-binding protein [Streptomyces albaduncus]MBB5126058.1 serine phosphatase RsbU (regulator of sigma subunit)/PAS domain-containing protein/anti-sigma regulatory factor (Ser/Thr protein kinase) [Streptomyces albaduncus]GGW49726.1 histidine kinase [Streptomyces albaduncus]
MAGFLGRLRPVVTTRPVAHQVFALQVVIVLLLALAAAAALVLQARADTEREARNRALAVAQSFSQAPGVRTALRGEDPSAVLQPRAEAARRASGVDFIVVMTPRGIRYTHPDPAQIGRRYIGTIGPASHGGTVMETVTGTLGPSTRAVVPVKDPDGTVIGLVAAGITLDRVRETANRQVPLLLSATGVALGLSVLGTGLVSRRLRQQTHGLEPAEMTRMYEHHDAVLHAVREGVLIVGGDGRLALANDEARRLLDLPPDAEGRTATANGVDPDLARLLAEGREATDEVYTARGRLLAVSQRPTGRDGGPAVVTLRDTTELQALAGRADVARQRLRLLYDAGLRIGSRLDVVYTSQELADFAVPRFADYVAVDLAEPVLSGEEPTRGDPVLRRVAFSGIRDDTPFLPLGELIRFSPATPQGAGFRSGESVLESDMADFAGWHEPDPERARKVVASGTHSMITVPLRARGVVLGVASFYRSRKPEPFEADDVALGEELVARAAVSIDNARRYTREHAMAATLQRSLLPRALPQQNALDVAHRYLPAQAGRGGVGGDWFDVIPLPGARVALVVGDVVGHGLHAAATMGRLRTAVHNFSTLDLPPDELLWHLDDLVTRIDQDESGEVETAPVTGATCLYVVYDPSTRWCTLARAGHLLPAVVHPDGRAEFIDVPAGPPLGLGGLPFETAELRLPPGSSLVLYTDGLVEDRHRDIDEGLELLRRALTDSAGAPEEACDTVLRALLPERPRDDVALLIARTRALGDDHTAAWDVPSDPSAVGGVRSAVTRTMAGWGLEEESFVTELIISELVTNAIRHASPPIHVRLIRDRALICEVSDGSSTSPHLRRAAATDEGGRGLFLVARFAERWGTRYTANGKVIWTEQPLPVRHRAAGDGE